MDTIKTVITNLFRIKFFKEWFVQNLICVLIHYFLSLFLCSFDYTNDQIFELLRPIMLQVFHVKHLNRREVQSRDFFRHFSIQINRLSSFWLFFCILCRKKRSASKDESKPEKEEDPADLHPLASVTKIDPEEIPKDPENRFLNRIREDKNKENEPKNNESEKSSFRKRPRIRGYTRSGRVIKGRGTLVGYTFWIFCFISMAFLKCLLPKFAH